MSASGLVIRDGQSAILQEGYQVAMAARIGTFVAENEPELLANHPDFADSEAILGQIKHACEIGFSLERDIRRFVILALQEGREFGKRPSDEPMMALLKDVSVTPIERLDKAEELRSGLREEHQ